MSRKASPVAMRRHIQARHDWDSDRVRSRGPLDIRGIAGAQHEANLQLVISSRCLRILNPRAILTNAASFKARP